MKQYKKPMMFEIEIIYQGIIANSDLKYTDESADSDYEVLSSEYRGDWGNIWK